MLIVRATMKKSPFIKLLEYGEQIGTRGADEKEIFEWALRTGVIPDNKDKVSKRILDNFLYECFDKTGDGSRILKVEYYFRLIEYRELEESRIASRQANRNSFIAILFSIAAIVISSIIGYQQLTGSVSISSSQVREIVNANSQPITGNITIESTQIEALIDAIKSSNKEIQAGQPPSSAAP